MKLTEAEVKQWVHNYQDNVRALLCEDWLELKANLTELKEEISALKAERGVLLNGTEMIARYALPYFEKLNRDNPSHDTAELVSASLYAIQSHTPEANQLSVEWMNKMRSDKAGLERKVQELTDEIKRLTTCDCGRKLVHGPGVCPVCDNDE
jgi:hypothetical protein